RGVRSVARDLQLHHRWRGVALVARPAPPCAIHSEFSPSLMTVRRAPRHRSLTLLGLAVLTLAACNENISGGAACPSLCPGQQLEVHDTVLFASDLFDTTALVNGMPPLGTETNLLVARWDDAAGDSIVSSAVIRFDSLQS